MPESESGFGWKNMNRNQIDDSICKFSPVSVEKHSLHFLYPHLIEQALKV